MERSIIAGYLRLLDSLLICHIDDEFICPSEQDINAMNKMIGTLDPKEEGVIRQYYGLGIERQELESLAQELGVTRERIGQYLGKGLRKLRHPDRVAAFKRCLKTQQPRMLENEVLALELKVIDIKDGIRATMKALETLLKK